MLRKSWINTRSQKFLSLMSALLLMLGFMLLNTGEPTNMPNPLFKPGITLIYVGFGVFLLRAFLAFVLLRSAPSSQGSQKQNLKRHFFSYFSAAYPFFLALLGVISLGVISLQFSADKSMTWGFLRRHLLEPSFFLLLISLYVYMLKPHQERMLLYVCLCIISLHPLLTIADFYYHGIESGRTFSSMLGSYRPMPFFFSEAQTGYGFFLIISLSFSLALYAKSRYKLAALLVLLNIIACFMTNTRLVYVACFVILLAPLILLPYRYKRKLLFVALGACALLFMVFYHISVELSPRYNIHSMLENFSRVIALPPAAMGRFDDICEDTQKCMPQSFPKDPETAWEHSSLNRLSMAKSTWLGILDSPLRPNGFGLGLFAKNIVRIFGQDGEQIPYYIQHQDDGTILPYYWTNHHGLLYLWFELGGIGFVFILWLHGWILLQARKIYYTGRSTHTAVFALGMTLSILGLIVANCFDALPNRAGTLILFMLFGVFVALCVKSKESNRQPQHLPRQGE